MTEIKYPNITVTFIGENGNVFNLIGICYMTMKEHGVSREERKAFFNEVTSQESYEDAIIMMAKWVNII